MRILLLMDPGIPVPPTAYGGHERLVYIFAEAYTKLGHEVSLLAGPNSKISGQTYSFGINDLKRSKWQKFKELIFVWNFLYKKKKEFDLIHNFGRLAYLIPILNYSADKLMTYGRPVATKGVKFINTLPNKNLVFTACSNYCVSTGNIAGNWKTVYNAIDFSKYELNVDLMPNAPLMFLGRMDKIKGLHIAIEVALATNHKLLIGGKMPDTADNELYFKETIAPKIDGEQIIYLGELNDAQKNKFLKEAQALLFPIEWDEPFGMVMIEAMACGTPVIGFKRGSVSEVITEGITGYAVENRIEMINAINFIDKIDRKKCRLEAKLRFDVDIIANNYLALIS